MAIGFLAIGCSGSTGPKETVTPWAILSIDTVAATPGDHVTVNVRLKQVDCGGPHLDSLGGFELLIAYDSSALTLTGGVARGQAISEWEYLGYRRSGRTVCSSCKLGVLNVAALRDAQNGAHPDPPQYNPEGILIALGFSVTRDAPIGGAIAPIGFCLQQCRDNTLSGERGLHALYAPNITLGSILRIDSYDTINCPQTARLPVLELQSGWVRVFPPPLVIRGDVNANGIAFELGDAVLLSNFFIDGYSVFDPAKAPRQIAASDCNGDGEPLTIADLEFLVRFIEGDVQPGDTLPAPYMDTVTILPRRVDNRWVLSARSTVQVDQLYLQIADTGTGEFTVRYLSDSARRVPCSLADGTYRIMFANSKREDIFGPEWRNLVDITTPSRVNLNIVAAQASRYPGVSMTVLVIRPINGVAEDVTLRDVPRSIR